MSWRMTGKRVVFTNGCFDILHQGHIDILLKAASFGDMLIIGLNSDDSVRRLKGTGRPINLQYPRALVLAAMEFVDGVVFFEQDDPAALIRLIRPDVLVKGNDYTQEQIAGAADVLAYGGRVMRVPLTEGYSTSALIARMAGMGPVNH